jgi:hypothetical protein
VSGLSLPSSVVIALSAIAIVAKDSKMTRKKRNEMKLSLLFASALFLGCAAKAVHEPPKKPDPLVAPIQRASVADCGRVYGRIITIALTESLEPEQLFSKEALEEGANQLNAFYTQTGRKQLFFAYCTAKLNISQTSCMEKAKSLEDMDACEQLHSK